MGSRCDAGVLTGRPRPRNFSLMVWTTASMTESLMISIEKKNMPTDFACLKLREDLHAIFFAFQRLRIT